MTQAAERAPADRYGYRPVSTARTFGQLIAHIADAYNDYCAFVAGQNVEWSDAIEQGSTDKATVTRQPQRSLDTCSPAYARNGEPGALIDNLAHTNVHYGNIPDRFSWTADISKDDGETWVEGHMRLEARRIGPPSYAGSARTREDRRERGNEAVNRASDVLPGTRRRQGIAPGRIPLWTEGFSMPTDPAMPPNVKQAVPFFMVTDIEASFRFYVDGVGFAVTKEWRPEEAGGRIQWCWLQLGDAALMLQEYRRDGGPGGAPKGPLGQGVSICFMCADAIAIYHELGARGIAARRPFVGNGLWVTSVQDPDGYRLDFESPTDVPEETVYSG